MPIILQATGVSGLRANTYILNFPTVNPTRDDYSFFYKTMRHAQAAGCSAIVTKNIENFPQKSSDKIEGVRTFVSFSNLQYHIFLYKCIYINKFLTIILMQYF